MQRYSLEIAWKTGCISYEHWDFIVITDRNTESVKRLIIEAQKEFDFESPIDLMDYVCESHDMKWEDHSFDIEINTNELGM